VALQEKSLLFDCARINFNFLWYSLLASELHIGNCARGGIKSALPDAKVINGMATLGTLAAYLRVEKGKMFLDKDKSKVVRFREM